MGSRVVAAVAKLARAAKIYRNRLNIGVHSKAFRPECKMNEPESYRLARARRTGRGRTEKGALLES